MTSHGSGTGRFFDDMSRLMTNAMGVAQGAKSEAETAMKGWVDRWLADRNLVTREEFEVVREMAIKARTENAELRAMIAAMSGGAGTRAQGGTGGTGAATQAANAPHVSEADAPAADMTPPDPGNVGGSDAPHASEADAPVTDMTPPGAGDVRGTAFDGPHVSAAEAPTTDMTPPNVGNPGGAGGAGTGTSEAEAPATDMPPRG